MSAQDPEGGGFWSRAKSFLGIGSINKQETSPIEDTILDEVVISTDRKPNWIKRNFSKDKFSNDLKNIKENTGWNHGVKELVKTYKSIQKLGGYKIWGFGSEEMGRNDIKIEGEHKHIDASNIPMPGLGGIETKPNTTANLVQYLTNSFGVFNSMSEVKSDSVYQTIGTDPGSGFIIYKTNNRNDAQKQKAKMEKNGALYIQINATKK
ncbi:hypothetical protein EG240_14905 [Paenimyroides tangerinum]|uniref:Uncharacterized protein n=1 Tax=Paenimyroides tangerinum TaxID=2488728 RepID=A0A3P3VXW3_9FLAO|nr:hypothetical protein [Paenimyroides tangerinum]RRJ87641.1 hypothetical protein EG240_14905 [Paenimyroides tangerinum]